MKEYLMCLLRSLSCIEVKGKENLEILLGCIEATEQMLSVVERAEDQKEDNCEDGE